MRNGLHAKNDSHATRKQVFELLHLQRPRFDATFLRKSNAVGVIENLDQVQLFKLAWLEHFRKVATRVSRAGDRLFVVVATLGTNQRRTLFQNALRDVCRHERPPDREIILCHWDSATSWELQVADYGLWAIQRSLERNDDFYLESIRQSVGLIQLPWGM